jgi:hypothetical protein
MIESFRHPGGSVTGAPGHNAARVILGDHRALFASVDRLVDKSVEKLLVGGG